MVWSTPIMANNLKNKVTLKVRLFRRLSEVLLRRFVASPVKSVMPSTSSLCKCRIIILNNHKYSSFFYEDAKYSYKQAYGYFPGVVSIDGIIAYIENRDGNCRIFYIRAIHSASMYSRIQVYAMQVRYKGIENPNCHLSFVIGLRPIL